MRKRRYKSSRSRHRVSNAMSDQRLQTDAFEAFELSSRKPKIISSSSGMSRTRVWAAFAENIAWSTREYKERSSVHVQSKTEGVGKQHPLTVSAMLGATARTSESFLASIRGYSFF